MSVPVLYWLGAYQVGNVIVWPLSDARVPMLASVVLLFSSMHSFAQPVCAAMAEKIAA